jgi:hypothetical protein
MSEINQNKVCFVVRKKSRKLTSCWVGWWKEKEIRLKLIKSEKKRRNHFDQEGFPGMQVTNGYLKGSTKRKG